MREPENCSIYYCGFEAPRDSEEMEFEILGLQNLIKRDRRKSDNAKAKRISC